MNKGLKKPYEISLWDDVLVWVGESGKEYFDVTEMKETLDYQYYKEIKLCTIGSDSMQSQNRAINAKLTRKINGEKTLTFTVYYRYVDNVTGEKIENPYVRYLINERKVKLKYDGEWFEFIIKNIQENSESKAFTYTCKDLFVNELSKTGFEIELDNELENNMGTIEFLADKILEDSDWSVKESEAPLKQYIEEPLYEITVNDKGLAITNIEDENITKKLIEGEHIYVFYSNINDKKPTWQLLYEENELFETNDDLVIDKKHTNYTCVGFDGDNWPNFIGTNAHGDRLVTLSNLRGNRLVKQSKTKYDATIDKYVSIYRKPLRKNDEGEIIYEKDGEKDQLYHGFTETEYITSGDVVNYVANPSNFTSTSGWQTDAKQLDYKLVTNKTTGGLYQSFIEVDFAGKQGALVMNAGIGGNRSTIKSFVEGQKYILRMKYKIDNKTDGYSKTAPAVKICEYHMNNSQYVIYKEVNGKDVYNIFTFGNYKGPTLTNQQEKKQDGSYGYLNSEDSDYIYMEATCARTVSETELKDWDFKVGLFFNFNTARKVYIEDVQVFPYQTYEDEGKKLRLCVPSGKVYSEIKTKYIYYKPDSTWQSIADLVPTSEGYAEDPTYELFYESGSQFTKVRSISAKESNRFNLLQDLCETFQAWLKIEVAHNYDGTLELDEETHRPIKTISFVEEVGKYNPAGFRYGVNSKSIQRTVDSAAIVSKMIVKDNANEFAPNGFCSIARATENPTGENFLLNFDHYVRHGLLDGDVVTNDLYLTSGGYLGYYTQLKELNANRNEKIDLQAGCLTDIMNYEAAYTTYKTSYDSAVEEQLVAEQDFCKLLGSNIAHENFGTNAETYVQTREDLNKYWVKWCQCENIIKQHGTLYALAKNNLDAKQVEYDGYVADLKVLKTKKLELWKEFYKKYSRFIQEGSWIKEDYTDPNLYYMDAESTLYTSTQPKVTYNISVIDVSVLPGYEGYEFKLGDISYIEDPEFFGYSRKKPGAMPYKEEIIVSEITTELDSPEKTQIKVQNYKTQFEDLFQRITAQTQQAEYHTGEYQRAASVVEAGGTISASTLENSFANNSFRLSNARDQSVVWDSSGITTTSLSNPSEMVRIISGGIFLSTDGGQSWRTGITGSGINTSYLTAGQINTNEIYIMNGNNAAFRWDSIGLSAYASQSNETYSNTKYVRFDEHGIYGIYDDDDWVPGNLSDIRNNANFALTWDGFSLKNKYGNVSVGISSTEDFYIKAINGENKPIDRIKIGRLGKKERYVQFYDDKFENDKVYYVIVNEKYVPTDDDSPQSGTSYYISEPYDIFGIQFKDNEGKLTLETDDEGRLWLRDKISISDNVQIGNLTDEKVFDASGRFIIYDDGRFEAIEASIKGAIEATSGSFGGLLLKENELRASKNFSIYVNENSKASLSVDSDKLKVSGIIEADGGKIGGFNINSGVLSSESETLTLNGETGEVIVKDIEIGNGAYIQEYIKVGNAYIRNPDTKERLFIESNEIKLYDDGLLKLGDISIEGSNSKIYGTNFSITPNESRFSNVYVSGEIETSVFKTNSVQAAGGAMIFRPSYKLVPNKVEIKSWSDINKFTATLVLEEEIPTGSLNNLAWLVEENGKHYLVEIISINNSESEIEAEFKDTRPSGSTIFKIIIDLGKKEGRYKTLDTWPIPGKKYYVKKESEEVFEYKVIDWEKSQIVISGTLENNILTPNDLVENTYELNDSKYECDLSDKYEDISNQAIIGINSGEVAVGGDLIYPRGLTITTLDNEKKLPCLLLGDLNNLSDEDIKYSGYGLYADNVYLNGSLTTKSSNGSYAGVNTTSGVSANIFPEEIVVLTNETWQPNKYYFKDDSGTLQIAETFDKLQTYYKIDNSNIIFWAGAENNSSKAIQNAPFQVTEDGYVYVKNSIFAGGKIEGAEIHTAKIYGSAESGPALSIYNALNGISFKTLSETNEESEVFSIGQNGLRVNGKNFIQIQDNQAIFKTTTTPYGHLALQAVKQIQYVNEEEVTELIPAIYHYHDEGKQCGVFFEKDKTSFKFISSNSTSNSLEISPNMVAIKQQVEFSSDEEGLNVKMQYKAVEGGYDLYVVASS